MKVHHIQITYYLHYTCTLHITITVAPKKEKRKYFLVNNNKFVYVEWVFVLKFLKII